MGQLVKLKSYWLKDATSHTIRSLPEQSQESFEKIRHRLIEEAIQRSSNPERMRSMQWKIDGLIRSEKGMSAALKLNSLMWESFLIMDDELTKLK